VLPAKAKPAALGERRASVLLVDGQSDGAEDKASQAPRQASRARLSGSVRRGNPPAWRQLGDISAAMLRQRFGGR
jgi:hypothetical protein